jgi:putative acetyltransferase
MIPDDREALFDIWLRSVQATHSFVSPSDIESFVPLVRNYLASSDPQFWVLCSDAGQTMGFMGLSANKIESMFLAPEFLRCGGGRMLIEHARSLH